MPEPAGDPERPEEPVELLLADPAEQEPEAGSSEREPPPDDDYVPL